MSLESQHAALLESDPCIVRGSVQPTSLRCKGCNKDISLKERGAYHVGLWEKHRSICHGVQTLLEQWELEQEEEEEEQREYERVMDALDRINSAYEEIGR